MARHGWEVAKVYRDNDASATKGPRPAWDELLRDLEAGLYEVLVCWHTDRLYRRVRDLVELVELAERRALRISSVRAADLDLSTPAGRMLAGMLGHAARYEVEQKGARQVAANRARAQRGVVLWTRRPFGFDRDGHEVTVVESEAAEIRQAAAAVLDGATLASVAAELNGRSVPTSTGGRWTVTTVKRVLTNPRVAGRVVYRGDDMGIQGPAILDEQTFDRLTAVLSDPRRRTAPSTTARHLLSGIALCGRPECGREPMFYTANGADRVPVYRCRRCYGTRHRDRVDEVVRAVIARRLSRPDAARIFAAGADVADLRSRAAEIRSRRDALAALLADGVLSPDAVREQATKLAGHLAEVEREIDSASGTSPVAAVLAHDDVAHALDALPLPDMREVIRALCEVVILPAGKGVRFSPEQVAIEWRGGSSR